MLCIICIPRYAHAFLLHIVETYVLSRIFAGIMVTTDLDGRVNYGHLFSMELPKTFISMDVNLAPGTSCLPPSKIVQVMSTMLVEARPGDVFKSEGA